MRPQVFLQTQVLGPGGREDGAGLDFQHTFTSWGPEQTNKQIRAVFTIEPSRRTHQKLQVVGVPEMGS